jgi:hypothetical protein
VTTGPPSVSGIELAVIVGDGDSGIARAEPKPFVPFVGGRSGFMDTAPADIGVTGGGILVAPTRCRFVPDGELHAPISHDNMRMIAHSLRKGLEAVHLQRRVQGDIDLLRASFERRSASIDIVFGIAVE